MERTLAVPLRRCMEAFLGSGDWAAFVGVQDIPIVKTGILLCDVWDSHWCSAFDQRAGEIVPRIARTVEVLRQAGVLVIHAPSGVLSFYADSPARRRALAVPEVPLRYPRAFPDVPHPLDTSDRGCESREAPDHSAWTRQHPEIRIDDSDYIAADHAGVLDGGSSIFGILRATGMEYLLYAGFAANMCVIDRSFGIKAMTRLGVRCVLVRDLTCALYDSRRPPFVHQVDADRLSVEYVERYWCPTVTSGELVDAVRALEGGQTNG